MTCVHIFVCRSLAGYNVCAIPVCLDADDSVMNPYFKLDLAAQVPLTKLTKVF